MTRHGGALLAAAAAILLLAATSGCTKGQAVPLRVAPSPETVAPPTPETNSLLGGSRLTPSPAPEPSPEPTTLRLPSPRPPRTDRLNWLTREDGPVLITVDGARAAFPEELSGPFLIGATTGQYLFDAALPDFEIGAVVLAVPDPEGEYFLPGQWRLLVFEGSAEPLHAYTPPAGPLCDPTDLRWLPSGEAIAVKFGDPSCGMLLLSPEAGPLWQAPTVSGEATIMFSPDSEWLAVVEFTRAGHVVRAEFFRTASPADHVLSQAAEAPSGLAPLLGLPQGSADDILTGWDRAFTRAVLGE